MHSFWFFLLLVVPVVILSFNKGGTLTAYAEEDPLDDETEAEVEDELETDIDNELEEKAQPEDQQSDENTSASPYADTTLLFVTPATTTGNLVFPAGKYAAFLVGFRNKGEHNFVVESIDASFRYPMDFNYYIQNFSSVVYDKLVPSTYETTLAYGFIPAEALSGRPFGLCINLAYRNENGISFHETLYNETVQIVEKDEGFNGETFFLYIFLVAGIVLLLVIGQQTLLSFGKKRVTKKVIPIETGTNNPNNVDYSWLPAQTIATLNRERAQKSAQKVKQSPNQRKAKRTTGSE